jgi:hypothetical protein
MATVAKATTYPHISQAPEVCGGQPTIDDTRVRVKNIVALLKEGQRLGRPVDLAAHAQAGRRCSLVQRVLPSEQASFHERERWP